MGGLGHPLQQVALGDHAAVADPGDGIQGHRCLVRQQRTIDKGPQHIVQQIGR